MIIIANQKRILSEIFFETLESSFGDFVNETLGTDYIFNYIIAEDLVTIRSMDRNIACVLVNYADIRVEKVYEDVLAFDLIMDSLIRFIHAAVGNQFEVSALE
ncbi:hypothetical protein [Pedobacter sp. L105]|uniref:hypothetical protein n=1 Tax=Pedobacter sp. L105 TaxID=1641871 RepID=UPI00131A92A1|nr:hypothetical protein [Pedobacter sp. L105]